jgi:deoxyribonuclease-4
LPALSCTLGRRATEIVEAVERAGANAARLLLEGDVGAGGQLGASPAELHELVDGTIVGRVGVCLDTAHLWGAGFDLVDDGWERVLSELAERWQRPAPDLLHGNDSAVECGSHRDRHASPGAGALGERFYRQLLADPRLAATPIIIEIPSGENDEDITAALARLHSWCRETGEREGGRGESGKRKARHARPRTND